MRQEDFINGLRCVIESLLQHVDDDEARHAVYIDLIEDWERMGCHKLRELFNETDDAAFNDAFCETHPDYDCCKLPGDFEDE
jgi:hypothetical protein